MFELAPKRNYKRMKWIVTFTIADDYPVKNMRGQRKTEEWVTRDYYMSKGEKKPYDAEKAAKEWQKANTWCKLENIKGYPIAQRL